MIKFSTISHTILSSSTPPLSWTRQSSPRILAQSILRVDGNHPPLLSSHPACSSSARRPTSTYTVIRLSHRHQSSSHHNKLQARYFQSTVCRKIIYPRRLCALGPLWTTANVLKSTKAIAATAATTTRHSSTTNSGNSSNDKSTTDTSDSESKKATAPQKKPRKVTTLSIQAKKRRSQKITMVTAYDYPSAVHVDRAGIDIVLVGDSCAMVELGFETTQPITLDQMIHHCQAVKRGAPNRPLLVGDMPFGSYEFENVDIALQNAYRMVKEGGMDAVKFEGGTEARAKIVRHVVEGGVAVLGHVGLTPQAISVLGGFRAQGRTADRARLLLDEALRLQDAGAFAVVLECIPANVASAITDALEIPTIGIGAGGGTSGQVLVFHDLLGMLSHPHHEEFVPKFCKKYASVGLHINNGLAQFKKEVEEGVFPGEDYSPYSMSKEEEVIFDELVSGKSAEKDDTIAKKLDEADDSEQLSLYGNNKE